jgi:hypothetical protein
VPCLRGLAAGLSSRKRGFDSGTVQVRFAADKVAVTKAFVQVLLVFPCQYHFTKATYSFPSACSY